MELIEKKLRTLRPSKGHLLTQSADVEEEKRVFASVVNLGTLESADSWMEVSEDEAREVMERVRKSREEAAAASEREHRVQELEQELQRLKSEEA